MEMPAWWTERRYGLFVHATTASVPAWAPIGQDAERYWHHLGTQLDDAPLVETLAHHRDRWGHIEHFDDFLEFLTFERFDAETWARLAVDAGARFCVLPAKNDDGLCWWDAPDAERTVIDSGPKRNVLAESAAACERNDVMLCASYSASGSGDDIVDRQIRDLADRYGASVVRGDAVQGSSVQSASGAPTVRTFETDPPDDITDGPWELRRPLGRSAGHNRNERHEHHLSGFDVVALLTEVVAKGGHLVLDVGAAADGSIPEMQAAPLRDAGTWIRRFSDLLDRSRPWKIWGDDNTRYVSVDGVLHAIDVGGGGRFVGLDSNACRTLSVERVGDSATSPMHFHQDAHGLRLDLPRSTPWRRSVLPVHGDVSVDVAVYRIQLEDVERPDELFDRIEPAPIELGPLVDGARPGEIVQLGDGIYCGSATVPHGVILRGLGPRRTILDSTITLERNSRVEHLAAAGSVVHIVGQFATVLGCDISSPIVVEADDVLIRASTAFTIEARNANHLTVSRCQLHGDGRDVGLRFDSGADHEVDSCELSRHLCAIHATDTTGMMIRGNNISARWWGVRLERTERAHVSGNQVVDTMRAVDVDGGTSALIDGNAVTDGDSGCIVQRGAAECIVSGNHWERCRIGLLAWDVEDLAHHDNHVFSLHEPDNAVVVGP